MSDNYDPIDEMMREAEDAENLQAFATELMKTYRDERDEALQMLVDAGVHQSFGDALWECLSRAHVRKHDRREESGGLPGV